MFWFVSQVGNHCSKLKQCRHPRPFVYLEVWLSAQTVVPIQAWLAFPAHLVGWRRDTGWCSVPLLPPMISLFRNFYLPSKLLKFSVLLILQPEIICFKSTSCSVYMISFWSSKSRLCSDVAIQKYSTVFVFVTAPDRYPSVLICCFNRGNDLTSGTLFIW
jgi:hypothetical protein